MLRVPSPLKFASTPRRWLLGGLLALAATACQHGSEPAGPNDTGYYPLRVGDFRVFDVVDTTWNRNARTVAQYQFRERVAEAYTDVAGRKAFRVVRSKRASSAAAWQDDSVLVVSASASNVLLTTNNRRTVELVFPVRENYFWNLYAFDEPNPGNPTPITAQNRSFVGVGQPFTAASGGRTFTYPTTATAFDESIEKQCYPYWRRQVYAKGQGPVYRQLRLFSLDRDGVCVPFSEYVFRGRSRTEVLVEQGRM